MRKTVTISLSMKPELYEKVMDYKEALEMDRVDKVPMSQVISKLVQMGFAYRNMIQAQQLEKQTSKQTKIDKI